MIRPRQDDTSVRNTGTFSRSGYVDLISTPKAWQSPWTSDERSEYNTHIRTRTFILSTDLYPFCDFGLVRVVA